MARSAASRLAPPPPSFDHQGLDWKRENDFVLPIDVDGKSKKLFMQQLDARFCVRKGLAMDASPSFGSMIVLLILLLGRRMEPWVGAVGTHGHGHGAMEQIRRLSIHLPLAAA
jgi:hypothetical protein